MPPLIVLMNYLLFVLVGGGLLGSGLYHAAQRVSEAWPQLAWVAEHPFHRYVGRAMLGLALLGIYPLARLLKVQRADDLGLVPLSGQWIRLGTGLGVGFLSLALLVLAQMAGGVRRLEMDLTIGRIGGGMMEALGTAAAVGLMEELLFRGAIFGALRKAHGRWTAVMVSSGIYALAHFFMKPASPPEVHWWSGLVTLGEMLRGFVQWQSLIPGFICLFLAGVILALAYERTGNLWCSVGLHVGWVFWMQLFGDLTEAQSRAALWFWGTQKLTDGWAALLVLLPLCALVWMTPARSEMEARA